MPIEYNLCKLSIILSTIYLLLWLTKDNFKDRENLTQADLAIEDAEQVADLKLSPKPANNLNSTDERYRLQKLDLIKKIYKEILIRSITVTQLVSKIRLLY